MAGTTFAESQTHTQQQDSIVSSVPTKSSGIFPGYPFTSTKVDSTYDVVPTGSTGGFLSKLGSIHRNLDLPSPGSFEALHREVRGVLPNLYAFDGAKVELTSLLSPNFQVAHSFSWASQQLPNLYSFSAVYAGDRIFLQGQMDNEMTLQARANYSWLDMPPMPQPIEDPNHPGQFLPPPPMQMPRVQSTSKAQAQISPNGNSMLQLEHDFVGPDYSVNLKLVNPNPIDVPAVYAPGGKTSQPPAAGLFKFFNSSFTGLFVGSYLQQVTKNLALGAEFLLQRPTPEMEDPTLTLVARYSGKPDVVRSSAPALPGMPPPMPLDPYYVWTTTFQPASGIIHSSYFHRLNQRVELATELQGLFGGGRKDGIATVGFKVDTLFATVRGSVDTTGHVTTVLEERLAQGLTFQVSGDMDYTKPQGGQGKVGVGFQLEA